LRATATAQLYFFRAERYLKRAGDMMREARLDFAGKFRLAITECGLRIGICEGFYAKVAARLCVAAPSFEAGELELCECDCLDAESRLAFGQIERNIKAGVRAELYFECKISELLFLINRSAADGKAGARRTLAAEDMRAINAAKDIIDGNLCECPKIAALALAVNTSAAKLQNDFKAAFGQTIHGYVQTARMSKAALALAQSDAPIYLIAQAVGCKKPGRFSEIFKKTFGVSPTEYRRSIG
jgi:AraC-like DNA-binding protein